MTVNQARSQMSVVWHDLECGAYSADRNLWRTLAAEYGDPVLEVGAGTGRIALDLARNGHRVVALDHDPVLLEALACSDGEHAVSTVVADARSFALEQQFALIIAPMQTIQVLGGSQERNQFLRCAARYLRPGGAIAIAISESLTEFSINDGFPLPPPDMREIEGVVYSSQPTAVREEHGAFVLERLHETITIDGQRTADMDSIRMDRLTAAELELEAREAGLRPLGRDPIPATADHVGSVVVRLGG